jgi:hypothetical protein
MERVPRATSPVGGTSQTCTQECRPSVAGCAPTPPDNGRPRRVLLERLVHIRIQPWRCVVQPSVTRQNSRRIHRARGRRGLLSFGAKGASSTNSSPAGKLRKGGLTVDAVGAPPSSCRARYRFVYRFSKQDVAFASSKSGSRRPNPPLKPAFRRNSPRELTPLDQESSGSIPRTATECRDAAGSRELAGSVVLDDRSVRNAGEGVAEPWQNHGTSRGTWGVFGSVRAYRRDTACRGTSPHVSTRTVLQIRVSAVRFRPWPLEESATCG